MFQAAGFAVVDAAAVAQSWRRDAALLKLYEIGSAKRLGARLWADLVVSHWPKLQDAVNDALAVERLLKRQGFDEILTIFDGEATQQRILLVLGDELYAKTNDEGWVFIFFAGHGQTQDLPNGSKVGYIIPVDGDLLNSSSTAISMRQLQDLAERIRTKHMSDAMDACFSGLLLRLREEFPANGNALELTTVPVRRVLTVGTEGERVVELGGR